MLNSSLEIVRIDNDHCSSNAYVIAEVGSRSAIVIDPADLNSHRIAEHLSTRGYNKLLIVLTHEHFDHMSGVRALQKAFDSRVVASRECSRHVSDPRKNLSRYTIGIDIDCQPADMICEDIGSHLAWEELSLEFVPAPGHSAGGICIAIDRQLFTGDTIIPGLPTVVKLPGGDRHILRSTVKSLLERFPRDTVIHPGHGKPCRLRDIDIANVLGAKEQQVR